MSLSLVLAWTLLHSLWQGAALALGLAVVLAMLPASFSRWRYVAACLAFFALPVWMLATGLQLAAAPDLGPVVSSSLAAAPATWAQSLLAWGLPYVLPVWAFGVALRSVWLLGGWALLRRVRREAWLAEEPWQRRLENLSARLGLRRAPHLWLSSRAGSPMVVGWLRPALVLPVSALTGLSPAQLEMVLAHELAHLRRHDPWVNALQVVLETLLCYHPAALWLSRQVRAEREHCCDDAAVALSGDALLYAQILAHLETLRHPSASLALAATGGVLMSRVIRLFPSAKRSGRSLVLPVLGLGLLLAACTTLRSGQPSAAVSSTVCLEAEVKTGMHAIPAFDSAAERAMTRAAHASGLSAACAGADLTVRYQMTFQAQALRWQAGLVATDDKGRVLWSGSISDAIPAKGAVSFQQLSESNAEKLLADFLAQR